LFRLSTFPILIGFAIILFSQAVGFAAVEVKSNVSAELKYPPIRLEVAESFLTAPQLTTKNELVQASQVLEEHIHMSGMVYDDPDLRAKLYGLIPEELLGEKAKGFKYRIFVIKDPRVNAFTTPSGSIYINSGLLAVLEDFDQMRLVMGHEAHHIIDQDIVHQYQKIKNEVGAIRVLQIVAAPAVAVAIGQSDSSNAAAIANIYTAGNLAVGISLQLSYAGYGRENENECDQYALTLFERNNYSYTSAKRVFEKFDEEQDRFGKGYNYHLFNSHDSGKKRADHVTKFMKDKGYVEKSGKLSDDFDRLTKGVRLENARLNIKIARVQHALDDLDRLDKVFPGDARVQALYGEAYASLAENTDILKDELSRKEWNKLNIKDKEKQAIIWSDKAASYFEAAIKADVSYPDTYRELALFKEYNEAFSEAIKNYSKYLELKPTASDKRFIKAKLSRLEKKMAEPKPTKE
jgi:predicted Zn-dependent protease